jgi:hypothetical protein
MMKVSAVMLPAMLVLAGVVLCGHQAGGAFALTASCEPGAELDLAARVVDVQHEGARARVTLEVVFSSRRALKSFRLFESRHRDISRRERRTGTPRSRPRATREVGYIDFTAGRSSAISSSSGRLLLHGGGMDGESGGRIPAQPEYVLQHTVVLDSGREHGLLFSAVTEDLEGDQATVKAYVPINLIPEQQPEIVDGLIQYRARVAP